MCVAYEIQILCDLSELSLNNIESMLRRFRWLCSSLLSLSPPLPPRRGGSILMVSTLNNYIHGVRKHLDVLWIFAPRTLMPHRMPHAIGVEFSCIFSREQRKVLSWILIIWMIWLACRAMSIVGWHDINKICKWCAHRCQRAWKGWFGIVMKYCRTLLDSPLHILLFFPIHWIMN